MEDFKPELDGLECSESLIDFDREETEMETDINSSTKDTLLQNPSPDSRLQQTIPTSSLRSRKQEEEDEDDFLIDVDTVDSKPYPLSTSRSPAPETRPEPETIEITPVVKQEKEDEEDVGVPVPAFVLPSPPPKAADQAHHPAGSRAHVQQNPTQPLRLTNFSICEILKPEFGPKSRETKPWRLTESVSRYSSRGTPDSSTTGHECPSPGQGSLSSAYSPHLSQERREEDGGEGSGPHPAGQMAWPAWVYCTRYSDRPSSGPRSRKIKRKEKNQEEKRPRTAFTNEQLKKLRDEFEENRYLTEERRQKLARDLDLNESQIKIWFQNKRAKMKKATGVKNPLALQLMAQGLYQHSTCIPSD